MFKFASQYRGNYYNKEQKIKFLSLQINDLSSNQIKFIVSKLKALSSIETSVNMDICNWKPEKMISTLSDLFMFTEDIVEFYTIFLKPYCNYCGREIDIKVNELLPLCIEQMPKSVYSIIRKITTFDNSHNPSTLALANALAIMSWYGADISSQTVDCIDISKLVSKKQVNVYSKSRQLITIDLTEDLYAQKVFDELMYYNSQIPYTLNSNIFINYYVGMGIAKKNLEIGGVYTRMKQSGIDFDTYAHLKLRDNRLNLRKLSQYMDLEFYYSGRAFTSAYEWDKFYNRYKQWLAI